MGSYATKKTYITNTPQTFGVQDEGILAVRSNINILDNKAIEKAFDFSQKAFDFSQKAFESSNDNTLAALNLAGILDASQASNYADTLRFAELSLLRSADSVDAAIEQSAQTTDNALKLFNEQEIDTREKIESNRELYEQMLPQESSQNLTLYYYISIIAGLFVVYKFVKKNA